VQNENFTSSIWGPKGRTHDEMDGKYSTHGEARNTHNILVENPEVEIH
jgi:hypothetical protein